jgi:WD40-like Beta Propeller Repeat
VQSVWVIRASRAGATVLWPAIIWAGVTAVCSTGCSSKSEPSQVRDGAGGTVASGAGGSGNSTSSSGGGPSFIVNGSSEVDEAGAPLPMIGDFPSDPFFNDGAATNSGAAFQMSSDAGAMGPCIVSPEVGTLYPKNWLRPRIDLQANSSQNLFQVTITVQSFAHPLVIYSTKPNITMDATVWAGLRNSVVDEPIRVSVRSAAVDATGKVTDGPTQASESSFTVAPVEAPGKIVYWSLPKNDTSTGLIRGFGIGEEGVIDVLQPAQVAARNLQAQCIGCHAATPDGNAVAFSVGPNDYKDSIASILTADVGAVPSLVSPAALATMSALQGVPAFSKAHWSAGDRTILLSDTGTLHAVGLDTNQSVELARGGDMQGASVPSWSHDGENIVYTSSAGIIDARPDNGPMDLRIVPYANGKGGTSTKLVGASDDAFNEYYPAYSPDDKYVAFSRVPSGQGSYDAAPAEVFVVPSIGGTATRLNANDAPACTNQKSPGLTNSWPKWSPSAQTVNGKTYYFLTFSSRRSDTPQLYVTAMVDDGTTITTYPALYLWNQPADEGNHTPDWEDFNIPNVPPGPK